MDRLRNSTSPSIAILSAPRTIPVSDGLGPSMALLLGRYRIIGIPTSPRGTAKIEVRPRNRRTKMAIGKITRVDAHH